MKDSIKAAYRTLRSLLAVVSTPVSFFKSITSFFSSFLAQKKNKSFVASMRFLYPILSDRTTSTPLDPTYFYQDAWCAAKIFQNKPTHHYDVASNASAIGIVSQFVPVTMIDIRPLPVSLKGLTFKTGDVLRMPFADNSLESLSSICVIEHIGLGRYGDAIDPFGSEKAAKELARVLKNGGKLYVSVPIDEGDRVYFNAHRAFTREKVLDMFPSLVLKEEQYIYGTKLYDAYDPLKGFGTGMFYFSKQ
jgi:SAM-dependent methyltransferase